MDLEFSAADEAFRAEARAWLTERLEGDYAHLRGRGGPGDEHELVAERRVWERELGEGGWIGLGWPAGAGGGDLPLVRQVIWFEEYARARGPGRLGHIGEGLAGPTILTFGDEAQRARFLPPILAGTELWCQGYSEPDAGSDLANIATRATRDGDDWVISGQKVWTSLAHEADWCFVLARTDPDSSRHAGLSYLLVPMDTAGIEVRPIRQVTGTSEFNEVFFDQVRTPVTNTVGAPGDGWKVAMGTLGFERGASTLGQQLNFANEWHRVLDDARRTGRIGEPVLRQRLVASWSELEIMGWNSLRMLSGGAELSREAMIAKLYWACWHRRLGELAMDVLGPEASLARPIPEGPTIDADVGVGSDDDDGLGDAQRLFLFTRADTIYAGSNEIQRNIIGERALGLPKEPR